MTQRISTIVFLLLSISLVVPGPVSAAAGAGSFTNSLASPPGVITDAATLITQTTAQLNSRINPQGLATVGSFRYGTSITYGQTTSTTNLGSGLIELVLQKGLTGLVPNTTYHFQATASSTGGLINGNDLTFKTLPLLPGLLYDSVKVVSSNTVRFYSHVNPHGASTTTKLEWGTDTTFGHNGSTLAVGSDTLFASTVDSVTTLPANSVIYFRFKATNAGGTVTVGNFSISTPAALPLAATLGSASVTSSSALLSGNGDGLNAQAYGWFEWSVDNSYSSRTTVQTLPLLTGIVNLSANLSGLDLDQTYNYRFTDSSLGGKTHSAGKFFTTLASNREYAVDTETVALYHLNEHFVGAVQDYANDANNPMSYGTSLVSNGQYGSGRKFNMSGDRIETPPGTFLNFGGTNFTLECWVNPNLNGLTDAPLLSRGKSSTNSESFKLSVLSSGAVDLMLNSTGSSAAEFHATTVGQPVTDDIWHHIAAVVNHDSGKVFFYIDGLSAASTTTGSFPSTIYSSIDAMYLGADHVTEETPSPNGSPEITMDEVRISKTARSQDELRGGGGIAGTVFTDENSDEKYETGEPGLSGWTVLLLNTSGGIINATITDSSGAYAFNNLSDGRYYVKEVAQSGWTETYPRGLGYWKVAISNASFESGKDFGNAVPCQYIGPTGGLWSNPANWSCGHAPSHDDDIDITDGKNVDLDNLAIDSISALRVRAGGRIAFRSLHHQLKVRGKVQIDSTATLTFPQTDDGTGVICTGDWVNLGTFDPGKSTITFTGNTPKIIIWSDGSLIFAGKNHPRTVMGSSLGNQFYNLVIDGDSVSTSGNLTIQNQLTLSHSLAVQTQDTVFILNDSSGAIADTGKISTGNIIRNIHTGSTGVYRFESGFSSVQFTSSPAYPGTIIEAPSPNTIPRSWQLYWEPVGGSVNLTDHTVSATHVNHFSKWIVGKPGGPIKPATIPSINSTETFETGFDTTNAVKRLYAIGVDANNGSFDATLSLRYDPSEVGNTLTEAGLQLYRGPYVVDSVRTGWNLVSLPVTPDNPAKDVVFPTAGSQAFAFSSTYLVASSLQAGTGYWLKFPAAELTSILGNDNETLTIPVTAGWNLIGALSYETGIENISSPDGVTIGTVYGYNHGYFMASTLEPLQGYWVKANQSGTLTLSAPALPNASPQAGRAAIPAVSHPVLAGKVTPSTLAALGNITVADASGQSQSLYFGSVDQSLKNSSFELPPPPPGGVLDARFDNNSGAAVSSPNEITHNTLHMSGATYPVVIRWKSDEKGIAGTVASSLGKSADLGKSGSMTIANPAEAIQLTLSPARVTSGTVVPKEFALHQNYPNPFNPQTAIRFDLPVDAQVTLSVFNVLGQEVASLIPGELIQAGSHTVSFDASRLASGVYFYTIHAGTFSATGKMALLR